MEQPWMGLRNQQGHTAQTVDNWQSRLAGYRVAYEYDGRSYTTILPYDPGSRLPVRVSVEPTGR